MISIGSCGRLPQDGATVGLAGTLSAIELGVIADDLTGGMMVASLLEREGVACPLVSSVDGLIGIASSSAQAVVVARKIRLIEPDAAIREARDAARAAISQGRIRRLDLPAQLLTHGRFEDERTGFVSARLECGISLSQFRTRAAENLGRESVVRDETPVSISRDQEAVRHRGTGPYHPGRLTPLASDSLQ